MLNVLDLTVEHPSFYPTSDAKFGIFPPTAGWLSLLETTTTTKAMNPQQAFLKKNHPWLSLGEGVQAFVG